MDPASRFAHHPILSRMNPNMGTKGFRTCCLSMTHEQPQASLVSVATGASQNKGSPSGLSPSSPEKSSKRRPHFSRPALNQCKVWVCLKIGDHKKWSVGLTLVSPSSPANPKAQKPKRLSSQERHVVTYSSSKRFGLSPRAPDTRQLPAQTAAQHGPRLCQRLGKQSGHPSRSWPIQRTSDA